jgi:hypothetical protein
MPPYKPWTISPLNPYGHYKPEEYQAETTARAQAAQQRKYEADVLAEQAAQALRAKQFAMLEDQTAYERSRQKPLGMLQGDWRLSQKNIESSIASRKNQLNQNDFNQALKTGETSPRFTPSQNKAIAAAAFSRRFALQQDKAGLNVTNAQLQQMADMKSRAKEKPEHHKENLARALLAQLSPTTASLAGGMLPTGGFGKGSPFMEAAYAAPRVGKTRQEIADYEAEAKSRRESGLSDMAFTTQLQGIKGRALTLGEQQKKLKEQKRFEEELKEKTGMGPVDLKVEEVVDTRKRRQADDKHKEVMQGVEIAQAELKNELNSMVAMSEGDPVSREIADRNVVQVIAPRIQAALGEGLFDEVSGSSGLRWKEKVDTRMKKTFIDLFQYLKAESENQVNIYEAQRMQLDPDAGRLSPAVVTLHVNKHFRTMARALGSLISQDSLEEPSRFVPDEQTDLLAEDATLNDDVYAARRAAQVRVYLSSQLKVFAMSMQRAGESWADRAKVDAGAVLGSLVEGESGIAESEFMNLLYYSKVMEDWEEPPPPVEKGSGWWSGWWDTPGIPGPGASLFDPNVIRAFWQNLKRMRSEYRR